MTDAARAKRNEYRRKWYAANRDKARATNERYWEKKAAKDSEQLPGQTELVTN